MPDFKAKMHQIAFGGRAPPGPAGGSFGATVCKRRSWYSADVQFHASQVNTSMRLYILSYWYLLGCRSIKLWNILPDKDVEMFEARLGNCWNDQPLKYYYKEELRL